MLVNIIQNTISSFISAGVAAAEVITTNLKMWLGFETSETGYHSEMVENGNFATDSIWSKGTGWIISNDKARVDSTSNTDLYQNIGTVQGGSYKISFKVSDYVNGSVQVTLGYGGSVIGSETVDDNGVYEVITTTNPTNPNFVYISTRDAITELSIDYITVKELTQITPDKSGNNNVGELFTGKAIEFDGNGDYVDVSGFSMSGSVSTFAFWINSNDTLGRMIDINPNSFIISFNSNQLSLYDGRWQNFGTISTNVWNRCVIVTNGTSAKCYVNGVQLGVEKTINAINIDSATDAIIGANYVHTQSYFDGEMSDFQIYNAAWTTDDVTFDYANPNKLAIDNPSTSLNVTNLKGYWALSEGDGKLAYDSGTNLEEDEVVNGDFATDSDWAKGTGISISNNAMNFTSQSGKYGSQSINIIDGVAYKINFEITTQTSGQLRIFLGANNTVGLVSGLGKKEIIASADTSIDTKIYFGDEFSGSISNVSVREITASDHGGLINGADYVDAQPRIPQLGMQNWSKGSNLFPYSEDFTEWVINSSTSQVVLAASEAAPYGQGDVYSITMQASESDAYIRYATTNATLTSSTHSVWVKQAPTGSATHIRISTNNRAAWLTGTSQKIALTSSWQRLETTDGITGNRFTVIGSADVGGIQDPDCLGKALIYGAQLVEGSSAGAYRFTDGAATLNSTVIANPTIPTQDIFGNAVRDRLNSFNLDGSGYATNETLPTISGNISLSFWVKLDTFVSGNLGQILGKRESSSWLRVYRPYASHLRLEVAAGQQYTFSVTENQWVYVAITINSSNQVSVYVDDSAASGATLNTSFSFINTEVFTVGAWLNPALQPTSKLNGLVSDVLIYDRVLTSDEVENNYNAGLSAHTN